MISNVLITNKPVCNTGTTNSKFLCLTAYKCHTSVSSNQSNIPWEIKNKLVDVVYKKVLLSANKLSCRITYGISNQRIFDEVKSDRQATGRKY